MNVFIPEELIKQVQLLLSDIVKKELNKFLDTNESTHHFLNKKQTCEYLNISNNTLDSWIKQGLPCIKVGKTVRFSKTEINRWLQKQ
ncbi:helix-turn-helix domain-containing protein [Streptococcus sp. 27098_8_148]|jgi:excisionase family DNA binding protein|uniref:Helix-turn-helix domain-containing protein n=1 Tax=Streptococcus lingualis TaxID=3098076 RepID=A0ABZ0SSN3_9STRE|nr:helix-turn-helix domain-containing protein [Streptococcus sp. S5]WPS46739.1 helix-turn-helix domain-containing protein [Streptococcus sp. S5]